MQLVGFVFFRKALALVTTSGLKWIPILLLMTDEIVHLGKCNEE